MLKEHKWPALDSESEPDFHTRNSGLGQHKSVTLDYEMLPKSHSNRSILPKYEMDYDETKCAVISQYSKSCVPLNWFVEPQNYQVYWHPSSVGGVRKTFGALQKLLIFLESQQVQNSSVDTSRAADESLAKQLLKFVTNEVTLNFNKYLALQCSIRVQDISVFKSSQLCTKFTLRIEPFLQVRNLLPYPVTVKLTPKPKYSPSLTVEFPSFSDLRKLGAEDIIEAVSKHERNSIALLSPIIATIPTNWTWGIPYSMAEISIDVAVHGSPIDSFTQDILPERYSAIKQTKNLAFEKQQLQMIASQVRNRLFTINIFSLLGLATLYQ